VYESLTAGLRAEPSPALRPSDEDGQSGVRDPLVRTAHLSPEAPTL